MLEEIIQCFAKDHSSLSLEVSGGLIYRVDLFDVVLGHGGGDVGDKFCKISFAESLVAATDRIDVQESADHRIDAIAQSVELSVICQFASQMADFGPVVKRCRLCVLRMISGEMSPLILLGG